MILYFSATGNSKYVAERIASAFNDTALSIERADTTIALEDNEMLGIVTPVNWWELPVLTREFLEQLKVSNNRDAYTFIVTTYGTTPGCTFDDARKILAKRGIALRAGFSVKMPDNWTPVFDLSDPEKVNKINEEAETYIDDVIGHLRDRDTGNHMQHKMPYAVRVFTDPLLNAERKTKKFSVDDSCIGCGLCAKRCPVHAIRIQDGKPVWVKGECALCLRCLHHCPKFAIQYGNGKTRQHGQYTNPHTRV
ncbi:MAG: EFR1 family ferrodoxin [Eggerthellaceae bacterium]|jgi:ferredoxin/flavodoxin